MKTLQAVLKRGWAQADSPVTRGVLATICLFLILAFLQLILTVAFAADYVDWFLRDHGWTSRREAPAGEVSGIYIGIGLRCVFSLFWIFSFTRLIELIVAHTKWSLYIVPIYGTIALVGYGYWLVAGGPWYLTAPRIAQTACGALLLLAVASPGCRLWLRTGSSTSKATAPRGLQQEFVD